MAETNFTWLTDFELDEPLTFDVVAETVGARPSLVARLAHHGLLETVDSETGEPLLPRRAIVQLRRMQRLRRDLGVNFTGAAIIIDLVTQIEQLSHELAELHKRFDK
jgi:chaperone modulatory protein CbpM